jgi:hypothetical protein
VPHRSKVKCDRIYPCSRCVRLNLECRPDDVPLNRLRSVDTRPQGYGHGPPGGMPGMGPMGMSQHMGMGGYNPHDPTAAYYQHQHAAAAAAAASGPTKRPRLEYGHGQHGAMGMGMMGDGPDLYGQHAGMRAAVAPVTAEEKQLDDFLVECYNGKDGAAACSFTW